MQEKGRGLVRARLRSDSMTGQPGPSTRLAKPQINFMVEAGGVACLTQALTSYRRCEYVGGREVVKVARFQWVGLRRMTADVRISDLTLIISASHSGSTRKRNCERHRRLLLALQGLARHSAPRYTKYS